MESGKGLGLRGIKEAEMIFIKLDMSDYIEMRCDGIEVVKTFIREIVTQEDAQNIVRRKFVRKIFMQTRIDTIAKEMKIFIIVSKTKQKLKW